MISKLAGVTVLSLGLFLGGGENTPAEAKCKKKVGFFKRCVRKIKRTIKRICKKTKRAIVRTGAAIQNKVMDSAVKAKACITGKKPKRVWVKGHYKKGQKTLTNGHFRRVKRGGKKPNHSGGGVINPAPAPSPAPGQTGQTITNGAPLPPIDPVLPGGINPIRIKAPKHRR